MKQILCGLVLLAGTAFGQMGPGQPQPGQPPQSTPPTFPEGQQSPRQTMPPDQRAPAPTPEATSSEQVQQQIEDVRRHTDAQKRQRREAGVDPLEHRVVAIAEQEHDEAQHEVHVADK